jgi:hypothetical protein
MGRGDIVVVEQVRFNLCCLLLLRYVYRHVFGDDLQPQDTTQADDIDDSACLATQQAACQAAMAAGSGANTGANDNMKDDLDRDSTNDDMDDDMDNGRGDDVGNGMDGDNIYISD